MKKMRLRVSLLFFLCCCLTLFWSCSNEPLEGEFGVDEPEIEIDDDTGNEDPEDNDNDDQPETIYATAKLDGEQFTGNSFEVEIINEDAMQLSFFSDLEQQIYIILPSSPIEGVFDVTSTENSEFMYSGAFVNSVGNVSESTFFSIANSGTIEILNYNAQTGELSGEFAFDVATFNNNDIFITEGEFEVVLAE